MNGHFSKDDRKLFNKPHEMMFHIISHQENANQNTVWHPITPRM